MKFTKDIEVDIHDVDYNGVARLSSVMKYMQCAAQGQLNSVGMTYDALHERGYAFILSKIRLELDEPIYAYQHIFATSYPCNSRGYSWLRCYHLSRDGAVIGRAASVWALVNVNTRALVRVNEFEFGITPEAKNELSVERLLAPDNLSPVGEYTVHYGELDQNRHMNNTRYPDIYSSFLPLENKRIRSITISYLHEAREGDRLTVLRGRMSDGGYYFRTLCPSGEINTEAEIVLTDIVCKN